MFTYFNSQTFQIINKLAGHNSNLDRLVIFLAQYTPFIFILFLLYLWFSNRDYKDTALYASYTAVLGIILNFLIARLYFHPRPFMDKIGTLLIKHSSDASFPSDHTTFILSIAFMLLYFKKTRFWGIVLVALGLCGGLARVYTGLHYPLDIIGSILVALISSALIFVYRNKLKKINLTIINLSYKLFKR